MKFDKYIKIGVLGIALWSLTGCTDWLDVQPVDQVAEEQMFTSEEGFRQGLNGVYVELCSSNLMVVYKLVTWIKVALGSHCSSLWLRLWDSWVL